MLLSIVTASYKRTDLLKKNFSFLKKKQNLLNFEWIIVCEIDDIKTVNYVKKLRHEKFVKIVIGRYKSADKAYNAGFKKSSGKYLNIHGDDDFFVEKNFKDIHSLLLSNKEWIIGKADYVDYKFKKIRFFTTFIKDILLVNYNKNILSIINFIMTPSIFFKKSLIKKVGGYDNDILFGSDYIFWLKFNKFYNPKITLKKISYVVYNSGTKTGTFDVKRYLVFLKRMKTFSQSPLIRFFQIISICTVIFINFVSKKILKIY